MSAGDAGSHSATVNVSGLRPGVTYCWFGAFDSADFIVHGAWQKFTTPTTVPTVGYQSLATTGITPSSATLNYTYDPEGNDGFVSAQVGVPVSGFPWFGSCSSVLGATTYNEFYVFGNFNSHNVSTTVTGLTAGRSYCWRTVFAEPSPGSTVYGAWQRFTASGGAPTVSGVSPTAGRIAGGNTVTITGTNFLSGATVKFGGTASSSVTFVSSTKITATAPAHTAGIINVTVTTAGGTSATSSADKYTYG